MKKYQNQIINISSEFNSKIRLDSYLSSFFKEFSRSYIEKIIKSGFILVNKKTQKCSYILKPKDTIEFLQEEYNKNLSNEVNFKKEFKNIKIIYQDNDLAIIDKPKGLVVHPSIGHKNDTLVNFLKENINNLSNINGEFRPGIVHRIDKDTSGLLIVAKNNETHNFLASQLSNHLIKREYYAIVKGIIKEQKGKIDAPITRDEKNRIMYKVGSKNSKNAVTYFEVIERLKKHTFIKLNLETGRTHQIRVHMAFINHPVEGDELYCKNHLNFNGQLLHAFKITFTHPNGKMMSFESQVPDYFIKALAELRK